MTETRGREDRQTEVATERRRRNDDNLDGGQARNLAIPPEVEAELAAQGRTARWINDVGSRMHRMTVRDDWDRVPGVEPIEVLIDQKKGTTVKAILVSKRKDFIAEDRAKKEVRRRAMEDGMMKGKIPEADNPNAPPVSLPDDFYADKANKIERPNRIS